MILETEIWGLGFIGVVVYAFGATPNRGHDGLGYAFWESGEGAGSGEVGGLVGHGEA